MPGCGYFQPSIRGMDAQSHALAVIGTNIANVSTGGYKRTDTGFATMISASMANVRPRRKAPRRSWASPTRAASACATTPG